MMDGYKISAGDLRTRVTFQQPTATKDPGGAQKNTFANVATNPTVWARWINAHGQEAEQSEALKSVQRATVTVRYRSDIVPTWQLLKDGEAWQIISVDQVRDRNRWVEMIVERAKGTS
jgi:SPP1 family predicted phage head-tail adaptor